MTCTIDHGIVNTIPAFLCRGCNPSEYPAWLPVRRSGSVAAETDFRSRHPLTEEDKEKIAKLRAINEAAAKARSYERIEALRVKAVAKVSAQKAAADPSPDLDGSKPVVMKRPGIVNTLMDMMRRKEGATRAEMRAELVRLHPDRNPAGMYSTIQRQSRELSTGKREDPKRGTVYYVVVEE